MKIKLVLIGKTDDAWLKEAMEKYTKRLVNYIGFEVIAIPDLKNSKSLSESQQKDAEGKLILAAVKDSDLVVLFDEHGVEYRSVEFADFLQKKMNSGIKILSFVVGGPYGFSDEVYQKKFLKLSLSKLTFSHQMIRVVILEQLYRAFTILKNEPYHHE